MRSLELNAFLKTEGVILDVRSPSEFTQAHLPNALSLPLFDDAERAEVGTCYKQKGHRSAVERGLQLVGPKLDQLLHKAHQMIGRHPMAKVHCWRGGMRSQSVAQLLYMSGIPAVTLKGGYKNYRQTVLKQLETPLNITLLGGMTGSGKTAILQALKERGEQVLDLELLANHRGSSYGKQKTAQPSSEQFENRIADQLRIFDSNRPIWIEDESRLIGRCKIPDPLFRQMHQASLILIERPLEERMAILNQEYGATEKQELIRCTTEIAQRLGGERAKQAVAYIKSGHYREACEIVLTYYDKSYHHNIQRRQQPYQTVVQSGFDKNRWADALIEMNTSLPKQ